MISEPTCGRMEVVFLGTILRSLRCASGTDGAPSGVALPARASAALGRAAVAEQIGRDDRVVLGELRDQFTPLGRAVADAVNLDCSTRGAQESEYEGHCAPALLDANP